MRDYLGIWAEKLIFIMFKQLLFTISLLVSFAIQKAGAQAGSFEITVNCANNRITGINVPPVQSATTLWTGVFAYENLCRRVHSFTPLACGNGSNQPRFFLDYYNFSTKTWVQSVGPAGCPIFDVAHGTWRVRAQNPIALNGSGCDGGHILVYNNAAQWIGWMGTYTNAPIFTSNVVVVGPTQQNEVNAAYKETYGTIGNSLFNYDEIPMLNTTNTINYENWWIAIFERGGQNRFGGQGWTSGFIPNDEINLQQVWTNAGFDGFAPITSGVTYEVQFAVAGRCNQYWVQANLPFFGVCSQSMPCREVIEEPEISLNPNPANNSFRLSGLDIGAPSSDQRLSIYDLSGRIVKEFGQINQDDFDVSDLSSGLYVVSLWEGGNRTKTLKLSIAR